MSEIFSTKRQDIKHDTSVKKFSVSYVHYLDLACLRPLSPNSTVFVTFRRFSSVKSCHCYSQFTYSNLRQRKWQEGGKNYLMKRLIICTVHHLLHWSSWPHGVIRVRFWDRRFESRSRNGCISSFFYVVLTCVGRGLVIGRSPFQGVLPKCLNGFKSFRDWFSMETFQRA
jgi:hypothetical protein